MEMKTKVARDGGGPKDHVDEKGDQYDRVQDIKEGIGGFGNE
jgi:hypothetical protein